MEKLPAVKDPRMKYLRFNANDKMNLNRSYFIEA